MPSRRRRIRVLVADDSPTALNSICGYLEMEGGFEILGTASDGVNVVQQAGLLHPDLVLVDLRMPRLGGIEVAQELRRLPDKPSVIIFSELGGTGLREECLRRGADGFVQKSHMPEQLLREVQRLFPGNSKQA